MNIYFVSNSSMKGYRSSGLIYALENEGVVISKIKFPESGFFPRQPKLIKDILKKRKSVWVVTYPNARYVFLLKILGCKKIILDAGWPVSDFSFQKSNLIFLTNLKMCAWLLFDFATFFTADVIFLESKSQIEHCYRTFKVAKSKMVALPSVLDEREYYYPSSSMLFDEFTALFRGRYNPESGVEVFLALAKYLQNKPIRFLLLCPNLPQTLVVSSNVIVDRTYYSQSELAAFNTKSHIVLGQLAKHPRLERTIPHRAVEAAYSGALFITARNSAICELFTENQDSLMFDPGSKIELEDLVVKVFHRYDDYHLIKNRIKVTYESKLGPKAVSKLFLDTIRRWE